MIYLRKYIIKNMEGILISIILGIIQGIGEFLPISSSAHLIIARELFNFPEVSISFDVALHFGTLVAVLWVYWKDWLSYFKAVFNKVVHKKNSFENRMFWMLVVATIPAAFAGLLFEDVVENIFRTNILIIAIILALVGVLIYLGDKYAEKKFKNQTEFEKITFKHSIIIGVSQTLALIPGFSRSGTTILMARLMGITREGAAKFTFLLSTPIIFGATILKAKELMTSFNLNLVVGIVVAAIVGVISIKFLLGYIKDKGFAIFAYYRVIIAVVVIFKLLIS